MTPADTLPTALQSLGFSSYEARAYAGLLSAYGQTAYALSKATGVPQPKIYEALRKLQARGIAFQVGADPQRFSATPPAEVLDKLRSDFQSRMDRAETAVTSALVMNNTSQTSFPEVVNGLRGHEQILNVARQAIDCAHEKVYLSAWGPEMTALAASIRAAADREVQFVVLGFGKGDISIPNGHVFRHQSNGDSLYPSHRNRHLAVVVDGNQIVWATSVDRAEWSGIAASHRHLVGLVRSYIRHDIYVQKIYARIGPELKELFGPGLELLTNLTEDLTLPDLLTQHEHPTAVSEAAI